MSSLPRFLPLLLLTASPVLAWEHTVTYRFSGAEIQSVTTSAPEPEDPWVFEIMLDSPDHGAAHLVIETDGGYEDCVAMLETYEGDPSTQIVITTHMNARTMNGTMMVECSER